MSSTTFSRLFLVLFLAALPAILHGCAPSTEITPQGGYRTIAVDPRRDTDMARQLNLEGMDSIAAGHLDKAAAAFTKALDADVEFGPAHNNLGLVYYRQKDWYKAAWEFQYAINLLPRFAEPRNNLGLVLEESGQLDKAVEQYRAAVELGGDIEYRANLARGLLRRDGHTDEVRSLLQLIFQKDTRAPWRDWARRELAAMGVAAPQ